MKARMAWSETDQRPRYRWLYESYPMRHTNHQTSTLSQMDRVRAVQGVEEVLVRKSGCGSSLVL